MVGLRSRLLLILVVVLTSSLVMSQEIVSGYLDDATGSDYYPVKAEAGQQITVSTRATSGDLDTVIELIGPGGDVVAENDDANGRTLDSLLSYAVIEPGKYTVTVSNYEGSAGDYDLEILITANGEPVTASFFDETFYTGTLQDTEPVEYVVTLAPDEAMIATAIGSSELDTYLTLYDANDQIVAENDDRTYWELDAEVVYVSDAGGEYRLVVSNYPETAGDYRLILTIVPAQEAPVALRVFFSGTAEYLDTQHFRIHYTRSGDDAVSEAYVKEIGLVMEEVWQIQIDQLGWRSPLTDGVIGGDDRLDIYLAELITDADGGDLGATSSELPYIDDETTPDVQERRSASYVVMDNDYELDGEDAARLMRATAAHEFHHMIQFAFDSEEPMGWYSEATATWMETQTFSKDQDAVGYVADEFLYPEVCFGVSGEADPTGGLLIYGEWLFIESLADAHGAEIVQSLWENIAITDGWDALNRTLEQVNDSLAFAMVRYHAQNLLRDYDLAGEFGDDRVWNENTITGSGIWDLQGDGIQELAANYFRLDLSAGLVDVRLVDAPDTLDLWLVGISGKFADLVPLATGATIDPEAYDDVYLMVFNQAMTDDLENCHYDSYRIEISQGTGTPPAPVMSFSTRYYLLLE